MIQGAEKIIQSLYQGMGAGKLSSAHHNGLLSVQQNYLLLGPMNSEAFYRSVHLPPTDSTKTNRSLQAIYNTLLKNQAA